MEDDGLIIPEVGSWGDEKYKLLGTGIVIVFSL